MILNNKHIVILMSMLFALLLAVPCVFKQDVKQSLGIPLSQHANQERSYNTSSSCATITEENLNRVDSSNSNVKAPEALTLLDHKFDIATLHDIPQRVGLETFQNTSLSSTTPLFIHLRVLII